MSNPSISIGCHVSFPVENLYPLVREIYRIGKYFYNWNEDLDIEKAIAIHQEKVSKHGMIDFDDLGWFGIFYNKSMNHMEIARVTERKWHMIPEIMTAILPFVDEGSYIQMLYLDDNIIFRYEIENGVLMWYNCIIVKESQGEKAKLTYFPEGLPEGEL